MTKNMQIFNCTACRKVVEIQREGVGELVCCGEHMKLRVKRIIAAVKNAPVQAVEELEDNIMGDQFYINCGCR